MTGQRTARTQRPGTRTVARALAVAVGATTLAVMLPTAVGAASSRPSRKPTVPLGVTVTPGPGQLVVSWSPPAYNGDYINRVGQTVPYVITDYDLKGIPKNSWASCVDLALSCTLTGLKVGHTYAIGVDVWNALGKHSSFTARVSATYTG